MRKPINEFLLVRKSIEEIIEKNKIEEIFKDVSENLASLENDILTDQENEEFGEDLATLIISYLSLLSKNFGLDETYSFLESRSHWGIHNEEYFEYKKKSLVIPFYQLRQNISAYIISGQRSLGVKDLFELSAFLIYWEEQRLLK